MVTGKVAKITQKKKIVIAFYRCSVILGEIIFFVDFAVNSIYVPIITVHLLAGLIFTCSALYYVYFSRSGLILTISLYLLSSAHSW